jgi:hypothetical protein
VTRKILSLYKKSRFRNGVKQYFIALVIPLEQLQVLQYAECAVPTSRFIGYIVEALEWSVAKDYK